MKLIPVLARAAEEHCRKLRASERAEDAARSPSANQRLFERLVPVYEELFGRRIGRSRNPDPHFADKAVPTGPAIRFFGFVFERLLGLEAPPAQTLSTWIGDVVRGRRALRR